MMNDQSTTCISDEGDEEEMMDNFVYEQAIYADTDEEAPKNINEVMYDPEKDQWVPCISGFGDHELHQAEMLEKGEERSSCSSAKKNHEIYLDV
jgi:hypothetical protein